MPESAPRPTVPTTTAVAGDAGRLMPRYVHRLLERLWGAGHAAYVVGGSLRDALLGRAASDWDVATDARPGRIQELFPGSRYENRFGTVLVPAADGVVEVTTFRRDHRYGDHRRPDDVTFGANLDEDLARRDFTVNALAWGRAGAPAEPGAASDGRATGRTGAAGGASTPRPVLIDTVGGIADLERRVLRAVGDPVRRFDEDALRLVRAARLAAQLDFDIEPATLAAMRDSASLVRYVSHERLGQELRKMLRSRVPSRALRVLGDTGILTAAIPELAAQVGLVQDKAPGMDCWEHTLATVDAARSLAPGNDRLALAALFHDVGKPHTAGNGHFIGHDEVGARMTAAILRRLAIPVHEADAVVHLVQHHMFNYEPSWGDPAVRRLVQRAGPSAIDDLLLLREADNLGSGQRSDEGHLVELRRRIREQEARGFPLSVADLAVDGDDLRRELGLEPGPMIGALLARLLDSATNDPTRNTHRQCILDARAWVPELTARIRRDRDAASRDALQGGAPRP